LKKNSEINHFKIGNGEDNSKPSLKKAVITVYSFMSAHSLMNN